MAEPEFADGGLVTGPVQEFFLAPCDTGHVPPSGACIRNPDGSHEWIIPLNSNRTRNLAILAETARRLNKSEE